MRIGFDIDNVLVDFITPYLEYHNKKYGTKFTKQDIKKYDLSEALGIEKNELEQNFIDFMFNGQGSNLAPSNNVINLIGRIAPVNDLYIITSRMDIFHKQTLEMIRKYFPGCFKGIKYSDSSGNHTKGYIAKNLGLELFVEDSPDHAVDIAKQKINVLLFDSPWNKELENSQYIKRIKNYYEILKELKIGKYAP